MWACGVTGCARRAPSATSPGATPGRAAIAAMASVQVALSALDRLEVRGRDSAGLHLHGVGPRPRPRRARDATRSWSSGTTRCSARVRCASTDGDLSFVYKAAAEIGELGDNTRVLRAAVASDELLRLALASPSARRRPCSRTPDGPASGIISEPNAHPLNSERGRRRRPTPYVAAALNGDVDNHADLKAAEGLRIPVEVTTDAKVIPMLVSRPESARASSRVTRSGARSSRASRDRSPSLQGSPSRPAPCCSPCAAAARRSTSGLAEDAFVVASEPYGLVEETARVPAPRRRDAVRSREPQRQSRPGVRARRRPRRLARRHHPAVVRRHRAARDPSTTSKSPQITTRDIDRGDYPHFLLKEIVEAPGSWRKTLRGRIGETADGLLVASLGPDTIPTAVADRLRSGAIERVIVIGQGTAAVAGQSLALMLSSLTDGLDLRVDATPATELSGFGMRPDMSDSLIVAISQSGSTTRHEPHRRPRAFAGRVGDRHRQPSPQRPHREGRTASCTRPTVATSR